MRRAEPHPFAVAPPVDGMAGTRRPRRCRASVRPRSGRPSWGCAGPARGAAADAALDGAGGVPAARHRPRGGGRRRRRRPGRRLGRVRVRRGLVRRGPGAPRPGAARDRRRTAGRTVRGALARRCAPAATRTGSRRWSARCPASPGRRRPAATRRPARTRRPSARGEATRAALDHEADALVRRGAARVRCSTGPAPAPVHALAGGADRRPTRCCDGDADAVRAAAAAPRPVGRQRRDRHRCGPASG